MDQQRFLAVLSEVAAMGQGGLQINEPGTSRSLPGVNYIGGSRQLDRRVRAPNPLLWQGVGPRRIPGLVGG
jgi:hypothetical protein